MYYKSLSLSLSLCPSSFSIYYEWTGNAEASHCFAASYAVQLIATAGVCVINRGVIPWNRPAEPSSRTMEWKASDKPPYFGVPIDPVNMARSATALKTM